MNALGQRIDVPNDLSARGEVVRPLVGHLGLGGGLIIVFAPDLDGEGGRAFEKAHRVGWTFHFTGIPAHPLDPGTQAGAPRQRVGDHVRAPREIARSQYVLFVLRRQPS